MTNSSDEYEEKIAAYVAGDLTEENSVEFELAVLADPKLAALVATEQALVAEYGERRNDHEEAPGSAVGRVIEQPSAPKVHQGWRLAACIGLIACVPIGLTARSNFYLEQRNATLMAELERERTPSIAERVLPLLAVRGGGGPSIRLPEDREGHVMLKVTPPPNVNDQLLLTLQSGDQVIWTSVWNASLGSEQQIYIDLPNAMLETGRYKLILEGRPPASAGLRQVLLFEVTD